MSEDQHGHRHTAPDAQTSASGLLVAGAGLVALLLIALALTVASWDSSEDGAAAPSPSRTALVSATGTAPATGRPTTPARTASPTATAASTQPAGAAPAGTASAARSGAPTGTSDAPVKAVFSNPPRTVAPPREGNGEPTRAATTAPAKPVTTAPAPEPEEPDDVAALERALVTLTNRERAKHGCAALSVDRSLRKAAEDHAEDLVRYDYFSDTGRDRSDPLGRARDAGYSGWWVLENLVQGHRDADSAFAALRSNSQAYGNLTNCGFRFIGVGYNPGRATAGSGVWVQVLGGG